MATEITFALAQVAWDRDGTSMRSDGTFSRDWGARVLASHEQLDLGMPGTADLDEALGELLAGTATPDQALLADDVNLALGATANSHAP